jgi:Mrp family chromosome partitioning ATPase
VPSSSAKDGDTDPEMVAPKPGSQPPSQSLAGRSQTVPPAAQSRPPQMLQAATQIVGTSPVALEPSPAAAISRSLHDDETRMRPAARPTARQPVSVAAEPSVLVAESERPKVWVATHKAPPDPDPRLILVREPDSVRAASFRVMRHRIAERGDPRVIAVTGPNTRDGKTTAAANLALALSEFGRARVLLLEANMRAPQIAVLFGFLPPECFSVQMQRHRERPMDPWSIVEAFSPSLHVLAVKPGESNRPLLDAPAFAIAIEALLRVGYDYIVIDTPGVLGSADVNLIEDYVDAVILTARSGRTMGRSLRAAVEQLSPRKLLGVMLLDA